MVGALLSLLSVSTAWANPGIRLQGQVTTPSGTPIDGLVGVTVRVYAVPTGGTPLYAETFSQMVTNGALDLIVGAGQGISENDLVTAMSPQPSEVALVRYLALQMDGDTVELSPRRRVTGGAFAAYASNAATLGGQPPAAFATTSSLQNFVTLVNDPTLLDPFITTFTLAFSTSLICCVVAAPMGWLVARTDMPMRRTVRVMVTASFVTPPFLGAIAWELLAAPN